MTFRRNNFGMLALQGLKTGRMALQNRLFCVAIRAVLQSQTATAATPWGTRRYDRWPL